MGEQRAGLRALVAVSAITLLGAAEIRAIATDLELRPNKAHGQNFVIDPNTVRRIVRLAQVPSGTHVLEVGPGLGSLTLALLEAGAVVRALEIDGRLASQLQFTVHRHAPALSGHLEVQQADALHISAADVAGWNPRPTALIANLPYNVAVPILLHLLSLLPELQSCLVMVQKEVAERLAAQPGTRTYGAPSAKLQWYGTCEYVGEVSRQVFWPVPNVDSALVRITCTLPPECSASRSEVFAIIDRAFMQRRKTLRASLAPAFGSSQACAAALMDAQIDPERRPETLGVVEFAQIADRCTDGIA